jgi:hypothetical protein
VIGVADGNLQVKNSFSSTLHATMPQTTHAHNQHCPCTHGRAPGSGQ